MAVLSVTRYQASVPASLMSQVMSVILARMASTTYRAIMLRGVMTVNVVWEEHSVGVCAM